MPESKCKVFENLKNELPRIKRNVCLKKYTTFRIGGPARYFFTARTKNDLIKAVKVAKKLKLPFFILGGGSNLLMADKGYNGLAVKVQNAKLKAQNYSLKLKTINIGSGVLLGELVGFAFKNNLSGMEWAVGIPGTVGGAIYGNAGSFGKSMADIVKSAEVLDVKDLKIKKIKNKDCQFGYRESVFQKKKNLIIISAELQFKKGKKKEIEKKMKECLKRKKETQPLNFFSAGSVFKNPKGLYAAQLIEKCGLKGKKIGQAQISEKHANFIVNLGRAKAEDVKKLMRLAQQKVKKKFGLTLKEEIELFTS